MNAPIHHHKHFHHYSEQSLTTVKVNAQQLTTL